LRYTNVANLLATTTEYRKMAISTQQNGVAAGLAALSICESLLIAMNDLKMIDAKNIVGLLKDAAAAHRAAATLSAGGAAPDPKMHLEVAAIIDRIVAGKNSIPRP
jgi:hypothetical protein